MLGGLWDRLAASPHRSSLPSLILANTPSLVNKINHIELLRSWRHDVRDCCVFIFTESWLNNNDPGPCHPAICVNVLTKPLQREAKLMVGRTYACCQNIVNKHCSPLVEFIIIKSRPFILPWEFASIFLAVNCISPNANTSLKSEALSKLAGYH